MKLSTSTVGDGPRRAALVHGLAGDGGTWFELAPWIADQGYTVTLVDQRGHGRSARAESYLSEDLADDLTDTLPKGLDVIVTHSLGGRALGLAVDRLRPARAVYLDPAWMLRKDFVFSPALRPDGTIVDLEQLADMRPGFSRAHLENVRRAAGLLDPAWFRSPNPVLPDMSPPAHPTASSLVVLADPPVAVPSHLRLWLTEHGYVVREVPGGDHALHVRNLVETQRAIGDWF